MRITVDGTLAPGIGAKDIALSIIARIGADGAQGHAIEYAGAAVPRSLDGGPADPVQPLDRGGRALRHGRPGRDDLRLSARPALRARAATISSAPPRTGCASASDADAAVRPRGRRSMPPRSRRS